MQASFPCEYTVAACIAVPAKSSPHATVFDGMAVAVVVDELERDHFISDLF